MEYLNKNINKKEFELDSMQIKVARKNSKSRELGTKMGSAPVKAKEMISPQR